jgi:hypothetical protein
MTVGVAIQTRNTREVRARILGLCVSNVGHGRRARVLCRHTAQKVGLSAFGEVDRVAEVGSAERRRPLTSCIFRLLILVWDWWH